MKTHLTFLCCVAAANSKASHLEWSYLLPPWLLVKLVRASINSS
jgi:hypothetical protein